MFKYGTPIKSDTCRQYWNNYRLARREKNEVVHSDFCFCHYYDCLFSCVGIFLTFSEPSHKTEKHNQQHRKQILRNERKLKIMSELWDLMATEIRWQRSDNSW